MTTNQHTDCSAAMTALTAAVDHTRDELNIAWQTFSDGGPDALQETLGAALAQVAITTGILAHAAGIDLNHAFTTLTRNEAT